MKRLIICAVLLLLIAAASITSLWHADYSCRILSGQIEYIQSEALDDHEKTVQEVQRLTELWEKRKRLLVHHVRHHSMDDISTALARAQVFAGEGETLLLRGELAELYWLFQSIYEDETLTLDNIF